MNININDEVRFKPTIFGLSILSKIPFLLPNDEGFYTMPLWEVMNIFGNYLFMGSKKLPIKGNILQFINKG